MRILLWHVHGGWTDAFVRGDHDYLFPTDAQRGPWGLGRGGRDWPATAVEVDHEDLRDAEVDLVLLQRLEEFELAERLLGRRLGRDMPAIFLEHNTPKPDAAATRHPLADRDEITLVHVTHFNELMWDNGRAPTVVIEHGIPDPGHRYTGSIERMAVVVNEPVRRWRVTGTDLLPRFAGAGGIDAFGMGVDALPEALAAHDGSIRAVGDLRPDLLREALPQRRLYLHLPRWTSLGLSLLEAMHLGMPVVALQATEAARAVPPGAGFLSTNVNELVAAARLLLEDPDAAVSLGAVARQAAIERYGLARFLRDWDTLLEDIEEHHRRTRRRVPTEAAVGTTYGRSSDADRNGL
ncbi:glycosyltransferase [Agromyces salentinus]|uniref:Glycosyltransferase n=1 Tax=Agromyces salentinus TaxID=269421 RepID=A0ABN2MWY8_9MICO|nr:glycosyltransferase [Agromyces salentinus]